jgi:signal transduction histidine kinase
MPEMKVSGALCLMSDLTELTALQKQIRWKENLAALGEMSAGIAHEFKNSLATISGYAQMIRGESQPGDTRDSAEKILDQTRALTHVVTEFLKFAKPLEICYETVAMAPLVERLVEELQESLPRCEFAHEGQFLELPGDEALLRQAMLNLARNGAEASSARRAGRPEMAAHLRGGQRAGHPGAGAAKDIFAVLYDEIRRHWVGSGRGAESGTTARREHRGAQPVPRWG